MGRIAWIAGGVIAGTLVAVVVNLVTSGGAWWLWLVLGLLVVTVIVVEVRRDRRTPPEMSQQISATGNALVEDSPQLIAAPDGPVSQDITAHRKGIVRRSGQTFRRG
jgi:hypothetical protein